MRSPERIKYELENELACCAKCDYCYPTNGNPYGCEDRAYQIGIAEDALEYIQQLERARDDALTLIGKLAYILKQYPNAATNGCAYEAHMEIKKYLLTLVNKQEECK